MHVFPLRSSAMTSGAFAVTLAFGITRAAEPCGAALAPATVHTVAGEAAGIYANAYLVEAPGGIVAIDGRLLTSEAKAVRARIDTLNKPLLAVLLTHGHPDHYNGVAEIVAGVTVPVVATAGVDRVIRENDAAKEKQWAETFGADWPRRRMFPNRIVKSGESLEFGGIRFTVHDLGPGESHADSYWVADLGAARVAFIGDTVLDGMHAYVSDGHTTAWLANLDRLSRDLKDMKQLYPGHGSPGGLALLEDQKRYLQRYRAAIRELAKGEPQLTEEQKTSLVQQMKVFLPSDRLEFLIALGADAVAAELARR